MSAYRAGTIKRARRTRDAVDQLDAQIIAVFTRIAINADQIRWYDLPAKPRKATDRRSLEIAETVEAEAMPARTLRTILRSQIEARLPAGALQAAQVAEASERAHLERVASMLAAGGQS